MDPNRSHGLGSTSGQSPLIQQETQPTVRVMRLYKPNLPSIQTMPPLINSNEGVPFVLSPQYLLPDSFGDLYVGETFSAYVAAAGNELSPFYQVTISVKLQTASNETIDLFDRVPGLNPGPKGPAGMPPLPGMAGYMDVLGVSPSLDVVVQHPLAESGSYILRVVVNYLTQRMESKVFKKLYRFSVLEPLSLVATAMPSWDRYFIQCTVTNLTKQFIALEEVRANYVDAYHMNN